MKLAAALLQYAPGRPLTPAPSSSSPRDALADASEIEASLGIKVMALEEARAKHLST